MLETQKLHVLARIGLVLLLVQAAEDVMLLCLGFVFANPSAEWEKLHAKDEATQKRTLGFFLRELRGRVAINEDFDDVLTKFLSMRNTFAHNLKEVPGWNMETEEGMVAAQKFLGELVDRV